MARSGPVADRRLQAVPLGAQEEVESRWRPVPPRQGSLCFGDQPTEHPSLPNGNTIHSDTSQEKKPRGQTESTQCAWPRLILLTSRSALKQLSYSDVFAGPKCYSLESVARPVLHTGILIVTIPKEKSYWMQDRKVPSTKSF